METYQNFLNRIDLFETSEVNYGNVYFTGNPSIAQKVDENNKFKPFYGDTIVFDLDDCTKEKVSKWVHKLYEMVSECFCEKLVSTTFHMTLHDLSNSPILQEIEAETFENELQVIKISEKIGVQKIKMKSKYIFNMNHTSLVLGFYPADEEEYDKLMELYHMFDEVKKLGYSFTPHITMGYYNINGFDVSSARKLEEIIREFNKEEIELILDTRNLYYQKFVSMNHYINIINLGNNYEYNK